MMRPSKNDNKLNMFYLEIVCLFEPWLCLQAMKWPKYLDSIGGQWHQTIDYISYFEDILTKYLQDTMKSAHKQ